MEMSLRCQPSLFPVWVKIILWSWKSYRFDVFSFHVTLCFELDREGHVSTDATIGIYDVVSAVGFISHRHVRSWLLAFLVHLFCLFLHKSSYWLRVSLACHSFGTFSLFPSLTPPCENIPSSSFPRMNLICIIWIHMKAKGLEVVCVCVCVCMWVTITPTAAGVGQLRQMLRRWKSETSSYQSIQVNLQISLAFSHYTLSLGSHAFDLQVCLSSSVLVIFWSTTSWSRVCLSFCVASIITHREFCFLCDLFWPFGAFRETKKKET